MFAVAASLLTTLRAGASAEGAPKVVLGAQTFSIPKENLLEAALPGWLRRLPGLDDGSRSFLVKFPASELAEGVPDSTTVSPMEIIEKTFRGFFRRSRRRKSAVTSRRSSWLTCGIAAIHIVMP